MSGDTPSARLRRALDRKPDATRVDLTRELAEALLAQLAAERANADALAEAIRRLRGLASMGYGCVLITGFHELAAHEALRKGGA